MANLTDKKQNFATQLVALATEQLRVARDIDEIVGAYFANGFNDGPDAFTDANFDQINRQLTSANVVACVGTLQAVQGLLTQGHRDNLRKVGTGGLP